MNRADPTILACGAAAAVTGNFAVAAGLPGRVFPHPLAVLALGLALGQIASCAAWLAYGRQNAVVRTSLLLAVILFWSTPIAAATLQAATPWRSLLLLYAAMLVAALWLLGRWGGPIVGVPRLRRPMEPSGGWATSLAIFRPPPADTPRKEPVWQFTLWEILSAMTALCLLLAFARRLDWPLTPLARTLAFCLAASAAACLVITVALTSQSVRAVLTATAAAAATGVLLGVLQLPPQPVWAVAAMMGAQSLWLVAAAVVLRLGGYH